MTWLAVVGAALTLITLVAKYYFSGAAAKQKAEEEFQALERAHQAAMDKAIQAGQAQAPSATEGWNSAWDAIDREMGAPEKKP